MTYSQITRPKRSGVGTKRTQEAEGNETREDSSETESSTGMDMPKRKNIADQLQERFKQMQAQFEMQFGQVKGIDMETTQKLIEENNAKIQKQSEDFFEKKFKELSVNLTKEIQQSNDFIFEKFAALNAMQNATLLSMQEAVRHEFQKIYTNMANLQAGDRLNMQHHQH